MNHVPDKTIFTRTSHNSVVDNVVDSVTLGENFEAVVH